MNKQTNNKPGDPNASLLLTSEKADFCNIQIQDKCAILKSMHQLLCILLQMN